MKSKWLSKTLWVNLLVIGGGFLAVLNGNEWVMSNPQLAAGIVPILGGINMVLRFLTSTGIK